MRLLALFAPLLLAGCGLKGPSPQLPTERYEYIAVYGYQFCAAAMKQVQLYLKSEGVSITLRPGGDARFAVYCVPAGPLALLLPVGGAFYNTTAYVPVIGVAVMDAKTILHEILHTFAIGHSRRGVMFPLSPFHWLATGASGEAMRAVRERRSL